MKKQNKGFTLIELLVVIAIIGLLSSVVLASLTSAREKAINSEIVRSVDAYTKAAELYRNDNNEYPDPGNGSYYCLGDDYPGNRCWRNSYTENATLNAQFKTQMSELYSQTSEPEYYGGGYVYTGILYSCISRINNRCLRYRLNYMLHGKNQSCLRGEVQNSNGYDATYCILYN